MQIALLFFFQQIHHKSQKKSGISQKNLSTLSTVEFVDNVDKSVYNLKIGKIGQRYLWIN